ncbi:MAG TPA: DUF167 domain-containing protein [Bdellovibrionota bacterium]|jgi:hypothetical protein
MSFLKEHAEGTLIQIHTQPKASRTAIVGRHGDALKVAVQAPPVDGAANEALQEFLSEVFGLARSKVRLRQGASSRKKTFQLIGLTLEQARNLVEKELS